jgi:hypothetical protein
MNFLLCCKNKGYAVKNIKQNRVASIQLKHKRLRFPEADLAFPSA